MRRAGRRVRPCDYNDESFLRRAGQNGPGAAWVEARTAVSAVIFQPRCRCTNRLGTGSVASEVIMTIPAEAICSSSRVRPVLSRIVNAAGRQGYARWSALAFVLLAAALLKAHELATRPVAPQLGAGLTTPPQATGPVLSDNFLHSRPMVMGTIWLEVLLAGWMLSGLHRRTTRWVVVGCFGALAVVALALAISGAESCGCFGRAHISPWYMCGFDSAAMLGVLFIPGTRAPSLTVSQAPRRFGVALVLALVVGSISTAFIVLSGARALGRLRSNSAVAGRPIFPNDPSDQCWLAGARMILAEMGLDPNGLDSLKAGDVNGVIKAIGETRKSDGQSVREVPLAELLSLENTMRGAVGAVADSDGHLYIVMQRIKSGPHVLRQMMHGSSGPELVPEAGLSVPRFTRVWAFASSGKSAGIPLKVGRGELTVSECFHNFGEVPSHGTITHEFKLFNSGDAPIAFDKPRTSCTCTTTSSEKRTVLAPGERKTLGVSLLLRNEPSCRQNVVLKLEDPQGKADRELVLSLLGNQGTFRSSSPEMVDFQRVLPGRSYTRTLLVEESDGDHFDIKAVEVGKLPIRWTKTTAPNARGNRVHTIGLELSPGDDLPPGTHTGELVLVPDTTGPEIPVLVRFDVAPWVQASPQAINLGEVRLGETRSETVRVSAENGRPVQVEPVSVPPEAKVRIEADKESSSVLLHVSFSPRKRGFWASRIKVTARSEGRASTVEIQCTGIGN